MKSSTKQPITLITGCSSGIGLATAVELAQHGHKVYATMRNLNKKDDLLKAAEEAGVSVEVLPLDVNDNESIAAAAEQIKQNDGRLTNLVNNAGYAHVGVLEEFSDEEVRAQFETN
ncbi:SDR family NAD(P)-dependent oxidoreductase, partial [bacterium]|nr:SDR family NAD(P)-dependent oxidoreductase [bacterium]